MSKVNMLMRSEPILRVVKRSEISTGKNILFQLTAILLALITAGLFIAFLGYNPLYVYGTMIKGALGTRVGIQESVKIAIPLLMCSLSVTFAFKMKFWNIGAEGQLIVGAIAASYFALYVNELPHILLLFVMGISGMIAGGLWGLIAAFFKSKFNTNETLLTLMLNYIALYIVQFLREGPWKNPANLGHTQIALFTQNARIDKVFGVHAGWIVALITVVFAYIYLKYTKSGYEVSVVGESQNTARYAGMNVKTIILRTMFISGAISGLAGMMQASGADRTLADSVAGGVGFTAIIVAWLAKLNVFVILLISFLFGMLEKGSSTIESIYGISTTAADVIQGIILFFVLGCEFFLRYKIVLKTRSREG